METLVYPADSELVSNYADIETTARAQFQSGQIVGNPLITGEIPDNRYAISGQGYIQGSPAGFFLRQAIEELRQVDSSIKFVGTDFLHLTLQEVYYGPNGRDPKIIRAHQAAQYYQALRENIPSSDRAINLKLHKVLPALDPHLPNTDSRSASIVASFLTNDDPAIYHARKDIGEVVQQAGLPFSARLGSIKVLFITLGRLTQPPAESGNQLLGVIDNINGQIPDNSIATIKAIDLISTTKVSYPYPYGHVFMWPPIAFNPENQRPEALKFLRSNQRKLRFD